MSEALFNYYHILLITTKTRTFDKKYYLYPVPSNELNLNKDNIKQNPGWE